MKKSFAIALLGGSTKTAAASIGVTYQAVDKWPDVLPRRISQRVLGVWLEKNPHHLPFEERHLIWPELVVVHASSIAGLDLSSQPDFSANQGGAV